MDAEYYKKYEPVFGKWYITKQLGAGSYGKVFEIQRTDALDGTVYRGALKAITIPSSPEELQSVLDEDGLDRQGASSYFRETVVALNREIALMNKVKGHSNIVSYEDHDVIEHTDGIGWDILIRMELLTPISQYFKQFDTIPRQAVLRLGIDLCRALEVCEKYSIIHRDIKPANIFISDTGDFKLGDFGVARTASASTGASTFAGTVNYMAPEVFRREKYTASVDTYSLGLVMYQLLNANRMPFYPPYPQPLTALAKERAHDRRLAGEPLPDPVNASGPLADILRKACAPVPADRFASPTEMRLALEAVLRGASDAAPVPDAGDATVRAAAPAAQVPAADAAATVAAAPKAPETPDAADETTRLPFGQQPAAQPTAPAKAPAPKAEDETVFLFAQQEQQRREAEAAARKAEEDARRAEQQRKAEEARAAAAKEQAQRAEQERKAREAEEAARKAEQEKAEAAETPAPAGEKKISRRKMLGVIGGAAALAVLGGGGYTLYSSSPVEEGTCGDDLTWKLSNNGTLTIAGVGMMTNPDVLAPLHLRVKKLVLKDGVTSISASAFRTYTHLTSVKLPDSVAYIGNQAFKFCVELSSITLPSSTKSVRIETFCRCSKLASVTLPYGVTMIESRAFANCTALESIQFPVSLSQIGAWAFSNCEKLSSVKIPESVTSISNGAFSGCALTSVTVSRNCKVHESAFDEGVTINYYD
jgi:hypothetical protein